MNERQTQKCTKRMVLLLCFSLIAKLIYGVQVIKLVTLTEGVMAGSRA